MEAGCPECSVAVRVTADLNRERASMPCYVFMPQANEIFIEGERQRPVGGPAGFR